MLFSIIVPIFNSSKTLRSCLNSIVQQTFYDYEVILVDDGSTDNSKEICFEYASCYTNVKLYSFENRGVAIARKRGIVLSSGTYIVFVDSDDTINQDLLQNIANTISMHPNLDIVRYQANLIDDCEQKNHARYNCTEKIGCILGGMEALKLWSNPNCKYAVYWIFAFKQVLFSNICLMPSLRCHEDVAYIPIIIASAKIVITIDYHGYNHLCNRQGSLTNSKNLECEKAYDFYRACRFAQSYFVHSGNITSEEISFFVEDYDRRLNSFFYSLELESQKKLAPIYHLDIDKD